MVYQAFPRRNTTTPLDDALITRFHLDLGTLGVPALVTEDLLIRRRGMTGTHPTKRDLERLAGIAARLERGAGR